MDTKPTKMTILLAFLCFFGLNVAAQEVAPEKTFEFTIGLNKLKTQEQADNIRNEVALLPGVKNCELELTTYVLVFECTNHDMDKHLIIDRVKEVIINNGSELTIINRTTRDE